MNLYLASASPRRSHILREWGIPFAVVPAETSEVMLDDAPEASARGNALNKALAGSRAVSEGLVIGADTVVVCEGRILGKPGDEAQAREMLDMLEGRQHSVITAMAGVVVPGGRTATRSTTASVTMRRLSDDERSAYLRNLEYRDKAGAYAIQGLAASFIEHVEGPVDTIVGFTMKDFYALCDELHVDVRR
jgi:septum formation protein